MENIDINQLADLVTEKLSLEVDIKVALIGFLGVVVGALLKGAIEWISGHQKRALDKQREDLLKALLESAEKNKKENSGGWRNIRTLSRVVGADENETKRLLIKIGARGSEKENDVWALISNKPLSEVKQD